MKEGRGRKGERGEILRMRKEERRFLSRVQRPSGTPRQAAEFTLFHFESRLEVARLHTFPSSALSFRLLYHHHLLLHVGVSLFSIKNGQK